MTRFNLYNNTAKLYDFEFEGLSHSCDEIAFYLNRVKQFKGTILEIACGTGRITIPLAESGKNVWGLDLSLNMLRLFEEKLEQLDPNIAEKIHLVHGDMASFKLDQEFNMIFIPFRSFNGLLSDTDRRSCCSCVRNHLSEGGTFIVDALQCKPILSTDLQRESILWERTDPITGHHIRKTMHIREVDLEQQVVYREHIFSITNSEGDQKIYRDSFAFAHIQEEQIRRILEETGFTIIEEMGYFDGRPISKGPELLFICI